MCTRGVLLWILIFECGNGEFPNVECYRIKYDFILLLYSQCFLIKGEAFFLDCFGLIHAPQFQVEKELVVIRTF